MVKGGGMQFGLWVGKGIMGWRVLIKNTEIMHEKSTFILPPSTGRRNEREGGATHMDTPSLLKDGGRLISKICDIAGFVHLTKC